MLYAFLFVLTIAADQWLKYWTVTHLAVGESVPFIPHIMQLQRLHNYGAAWSSLSGKTVLLVAMTSVLLIAVAVVLFRKIVRHPLGVIACVLILGGGIGNMIDRTMLGYVVDMIDCRFINFAVFNVADSFVCIGAGVMILHLFMMTAQEYKATKAAKAAEGADADADVTAEASVEDGNHD